jgi:hypothetical protein
MLTKTQIRNRILRRVQRVPEGKLGELDEFLAKLEQVTSNPQKVLSYAGVWSNLDQEIFDSFTVNLPQRRQNSRRRGDE